MLSREENYQLALEKVAGFEGVFRSKVTGEALPTARRLGTKLKRLWKGPEPSPAFARKKVTKAAKDETRRIAREAAIGAQARRPKNVLALDPRSGKFASARDWIEKRAVVGSTLMGGAIGGAAGYGSSSGKSKKERRRAVLRGAALGAGVGGAGAVATLLAAKGIRAGSRRMAGVDKARAAREKTEDLVESLGRREASRPEGRSFVGEETQQMRQLMKERDTAHAAWRKAENKADEVDLRPFFEGARFGGPMAAAYVGSRPSKKKKSETPAIRKHANMAGGGYPGSTGFGGSPSRNMMNAMNASANKAKLAPAPSGGVPMGGGNTRMMAEGAIVKKRTNAVIGEEGEEAVVPKKKVSKKTWEELKRRLPKDKERRPLKDKER